MNKRIPIMTGAAGGLIVGLALRFMFAIWAPPSAADDPRPLAPAPTMAAQVNSPVVPAEIRQAAPLPSPEARAALEAGAVKFIIRGETNSEETEVARILLNSGALPLCQNGETISVLRSGHWEPVRNLAQFSQYAAGRAWELAQRDALGAAGDQLPASAKTFLLMPIEQELRLVAAVEKALPSPLSEHSRIEIMVQRTPGGHVRWTLQRAIRRDKTQVLPNTTLPI